MLIDSIAFIAGLSVTLLLGLGVRRALAAVTIPSLPFADVGSEVGGDVLGHFERILFFISFWLPAFAIAGAWLTFKLASKWHGWRHIIRLEDETQRPTLEDRHRWSSRVVSRFLIGTLYNGLAGFAGVGAGKLILNVLRTYWGG